ncbi:hypothetical protein P12x_005124 [Tundrisphaera lichenicola]|uniref:hypothetical protein n=1 Tax=Tundrisphaera lichenicola TaxID=2029860 RepID=UPI003EB9A15E
MKDHQTMKIAVASKDGTRYASNPVNADVPTRPLASRFAVSQPEESLVVDDRSLLTPAQMVETKLISRLRESSLPVSHLQMRGLVKARYEA